MNIKLPFATWMCCPTRCLPAVPPLTARNVPHIRLQSRISISPFMALHFFKSPTQSHQSTITITITITSTTTTTAAK
jgi:hypothetical protein